MAYSAATSEYLLELLRCGLNDCSPGEKPESVSWSDVFSQAKEHSVSSLAYYVIGDRLPKTEDCHRVWEDQYNLYLLQGENQDYELSRLSALLEKMSIPYAPLKGSCMRKLFPIAFLREMCDLDILVPVEYRECVHQLMLEEGYSYEEAHTTSHNREYHKKPYLNIEIHTDVVPKESALYPYYENVWDRLLPDGEAGRYLLSWDDFYIFSIAHTYKHYARLGIGIRSVVDIFVLNQKVKEFLHRDYICAELDRLGLLSFARHLEELSEHWFSLAQPSCSCEAMALSEHILRGATYGKDRGAAANAIDSRVRMGKSLRSAKISYTLSKIFPSLAFMKSYYPILCKIPFLFPLFWPVRWVSILFKKPGKIKKHFNDIKSADL